MPKRIYAATVAFATVLAGAPAANVEATDPGACSFIAVIVEQVTWHSGFSDCKLGLAVPGDAYGHVVNLVGKGRGIDCTIMFDGPGETGSAQITFTLAPCRAMMEAPEPGWKQTAGDHQPIAVDCERGRNVWGPAGRGARCSISGFEPR